MALALLPVPFHWNVSGYRSAGNAWLVKANDVPAPAVAFDGCSEIFPQECRS